MDMRFIEDAEWVRNREILWKEEEGRAAGELSSKNIEKWKRIFFTGTVPSSGNFDPGEVLRLFPKFDIDGIQYYLRHIAPNPLKDEHYKNIQNLFSTQIYNVPGISFGESVFYFKYVFGDRYDPGRLFPFFVGDEKAFRPITVHPNRLFSCATSVYFDIGYVRDKVTHWLGLLEYFFSLICVVDSKFFDLEIDQGRNMVDGFVRIDIVQSRIRKIMEWCVNPPEILENNTHKDLIVFYIDGFRDRMDKLGFYPGDLEKLWGEARSKGSV